jgi:hypothetical protein
LADVQSAITAVAALMHEPADVLRLKIKELVAEYAEPGTSPEGVTKPLADHSVYAPTRRAGPAPPEPRYVL